MSVSVAELSQQTQVKSETSNSTKLEEKDEIATVEDLPDDSPRDQEGQGEQREEGEEELGDDEKKELQDLAKSYVEMPMWTFCEVVARIIFEKKYPEENQLKHNEYFTIHKKLEPLDDFESEKEENLMFAIFYNRIYQMLRNVHLKKPDEMIFALYGRKAGGTISAKFSPDMKVASAVLLKDFIQLQDEGNDIILRNGNISKPMKLERTEAIAPDPEKLKAHPNLYSKPQIVGKMNPVVLKDKSTVVLKEPGRYNKIKGKMIYTAGQTHSTVKMRDHLSHVVWVAWREDDPVASQTHIDEQAKLVQLQKELQSLEKEVVEEK